MKYLPNSAVITSPGEYRYQIVTPEEARQWDGGAAVSTIGYEQTADALSQLLGRQVKVDRRTITQHVGDECLVFRLVFPHGSPRIDPGDKGRLSAALMAGQYELGLLVRLK